MPAKQISCGAVLLSSQLVGDKHPLKAQLTTGISESVLLVQRGRLAPRYPGQWVIPTGIVDRNEWVMNALVRETEEELGIIFIPNPIPIYRGFNAGYEVRYYTGAWTTTGDGPVLRPSPKGVMENIGFGFFPLEEAFSMGSAGRFAYADALIETMRSGTPTTHIRAQPWQSTRATNW